MPAKSHPPQTPSLRTRVAAPGRLVAGAGPELGHPHTRRYCRDPRQLRHVEDGRAQQEVHKDTELRVRTRYYPVSHEVVSVPGGVSDEGDGHELPPEVRVHVGRHQHGRPEGEHPDSLEWDATGF